MSDGPSGDRERTPHADPRTRPTQVSPEAWMKHYEALREQREEAEQRLRSLSQAIASSAEKAGIKVNGLDDPAILYLLSEKARRPASQDLLASLGDTIKALTEENDALRAKPRPKGADLSSDARRLQTLNDELTMENEDLRERVKLLEEGPSTTGGEVLRQRDELLREVTGLRENQGVLAEHIKGLEKSLANRASDLATATSKVNDLLHAATVLSITAARIQQR